MKGQETRTHIVEASAKLFNKFGYHGCSMQHIMKATNLQKGGIYNHFQTKEEIALAAFEYSYLRIFKRFRERLDLDTSSTEKLISIVEVFQTFHADPIAPGGCPIMKLAMDASDELPALKQKAREAVEQLRNYIQIKIAKGKEVGEFYEHVDAEQIATVILSTMEGGLLLSEVLQSPQPVENAAQTVKKIIFQELMIVPYGAEQKN